MKEASAHRLLAGTLVLISLCSFTAQAADTNSTGSQAKPIPIAELKRSSPVEFKGEILPLLRNNCLACHNRTTAKARLVLETPADMLKGGDSGPVLEPGKGSSSLILRAAAHQLEDTVMPPPGNKTKASDLTPEELALLRLWIDQGAIASGPARPNLEWQPLPKNLNPIYAVALTRDGQFAACGRGNQIYVYHLPTRRIVAQLTDPALGSGSAHRDLVQSLDFNPAGTLLASGAYREIKLWQRPTNPTKLRFELPAGDRITSLAASPDGKWFATGTDDGRIRLWSMPSGKPGKLLSRHRGAVASLSFSPDGLFLCSGSTDRSLRIWSVTDGQLITTAGTSAQIAAVNWLPSTHQIASGGADQLIRIWEFDHDRRNLREGTLLRGHAGPVSALANVGTNSNQLLSGSTDGTIRLWDVLSGSQLREMRQDGAVTAVAARPDGRRFASTGINRTARLWDATDGRLVATLKGEKMAQENVVELERFLDFLKGEVQFTDSARKSAETNQIARSERVTKAVSAGEVAARELLENQKQLAEAKDAKANAEKAVAELKTETGKAASSSEPANSTGRDTASSATVTPTASGPETNRNAHKNAIDPAEREKQAAEQLKTASKKLSEAEASLKKAEQKTSNTQTELDLARKALEEGRRTVASSVIAADNAVRTRSESEISLKYARLDAAQYDLPLRVVAFSSDGETLVTAGDDRLVHLWNAEDGTPFDTGRGHVDSIVAAVFASDRTLITAGSDHRVELWEPGTPWSLARTIGSGERDSLLADRVNALRFSPDGTRLAAGGGEPTRGGEITLWNPATGQLIRSYTNVHSDVVFALDFNRDGSRLATAAADRFAKVLDLATGVVEKPLEGHIHHVLGVAWKRDGRTLATAGADNVVKIWEFPSGERKKNIAGFDKEVTSIRFVGYTDQALTTSGDGKVRLLKEDGSEVRSFSGATDYVYAAAATPDGKLVIAGGQDGVLRVWNGNDGKLITSFPPPERN